MLELFMAKMSCLKKKHLLYLYVIIAFKSDKIGNICILEESKHNVPNDR